MLRIVQIWYLIEFSCLFTKLIIFSVRRERELKTLYDKLAKKFPFLVQQGLYSQGKKPSLDHLLGMTIFGQPKMGRK